MDILNVLYKDEIEYLIDNLFIKKKIDILFFEIHEINNVHNSRGKMTLFKLSETGQKGVIFY